MKRALIAYIEAARDQRKPGFVEECFKRGRKIRNGLWLEFDDLDHAYIRHNYRFMPGLGKMALNAAGSARRVIASAAAGIPIQSSEETFQARIKICTACEFLDKKSQRCSKCGCFVAAQVIGKARLSTERCPENKWPVSAISH